MNTWKRITEIKPEPGQEVIVCVLYPSGSTNMYISTADFYDERQRAEYRTMAESLDPNNSMYRFKEHYLNCEGRFSEFGQNNYFDEKNVFWMELPEGPKNV